MNGLTDIFYDVVDSAVSKECKRLSSSLFSEDYLNELTTNQEKALFKLFRNIASLSVKFEKGEKIKSFEIDYIKELKKDDEFILFYNKMDKFINVKGFNKENNELSFVSVIVLN